MGNQNNAPSSIKEGHLIQNLGHSKRRCFVRLTNTTFCIQHNQNNTEQINLRQIAKIMACQANEKQFALLPINKKFICKTFGEAQDWVSQLQSLICTNESNDNNDGSGCGSLIFQKYYYTAKQMQCVNESYDAAKSALFVFGDNDIDKNRQNKTTQRRHNGGQAAVIGQYDDRFGYGITTTFISTDTPELLEFSGIIKLQFVELKSFLAKGRDVVIPSPTAMDIAANRDIYFKNKQQTIYHNLGTGIANLPSGHIQYIQIQINELQTFAKNNGDICSVDYYGYKAPVDVNEDKYEFERKMHVKEMENRALKMTILKMENEKLKAKLGNDEKGNQAVIYDENDGQETDGMDEENADFADSMSSSESYETLKAERHRIADNKLNITMNELSVVRWEWRDNGKCVWSGTVVSQLMEKCKIGRKFKFKFEGTPYVFCRSSQNAGIQTNAQSGRKREAKRIRIYDDDIIDVADNIWQWNKRDRNIWEGVPDGIWIAYSDEISAKINKCGINKSFKCDINNHTYLVTKLSATRAEQRNLETNTVRDVRKKSNDAINNHINSSMHNAAQQNANKDDEKLKEFEDLKKRIGYKLEWQWKEHNKWNSSLRLTKHAEKLKVGESSVELIWSDEYVIYRDSFGSGKLTLFSSGDCNALFGARQTETWPLRRKESVSKKFRYKYPLWWNMSNQPGSCRKYEKPILIHMYGNNQNNNYKHVAHAATKDIIQMFNNYMSQYDIVGIQGIQNRRLFEKYEIEKESLSKTSKVNEKILYHETTRNAIESIKNEGFRNEFCKKDRDFYGKGIYFGVRPDISHSYVNVPDHNGIYSTLVCKVITGESAIGRRCYDLTNWPRKQNKLIVDSLVSRDGTIYVIHENGRVYPMFIMQFTPKHNAYKSYNNNLKGYNNNNTVRDPPPHCPPSHHHNPYRPYGNNGSYNPLPHYNYYDDNSFAPQPAPHGSPPSDDNDNDSNDSLPSSDYLNNLRKTVGKPAFNLNEL